MSAAILRSADPIAFTAAFLTRLPYAQPDRAGDSRPISTIVPVRVLGRLMTVVGPHGGAKSLAADQASARHHSPHPARSAGGVHHAEPVALGIGEDDVVGVWRPFVPVNLGGT